jgi:nicotinamidase-related amidase
MAETLELDPKTSALLVMDYQTLIVDNFAAEKDALLDSTERLLTAARDAKMLVVYIVVGFRAGYPEVNPNNAIFAPIRDSGRFAEASLGSEIHLRVAPRPHEPVVTKHRVGAFLGTDLDMILRANGITTLVLAGIATSGVVLSTLRYAADADYRLVVAQDCCSDRDEEVHRVLMEKVFVRQANVVQSDAVIAVLQTWLDHVQPRKLGGAGDAVPETHRKSHIARPQRIAAAAVLARGGREL